MNLCTNCLVTGASNKVPVGRTKGSQRDPYQEEVLLCEQCAQALVTGDFALLAARYSAERKITR